MMNTLINGLLSLFILLYKKCQVGKDKYCRFQLEWLQECSVLLQDECSTCMSVSSSMEVNQLHPKWMQYCLDSKVDIAVSNPVMVTLCSALFDYLMLKIAKHRKAGCDYQDKTVPSDEEVDVYYRFGGAALCSMLQSRYDQLKTEDMPQLKRERVHTEITILKAIQATDKHHIPDYLLYRDKGYMYFPAAQFILFIQHVDTCVKEHATAQSLQVHGSKLVAVTTEKLYQKSALKAEFITVIQEVYLDCDRDKEVVHCIYLELIRKLCNTRIHEFLDVHRQVAAKRDGGATLSGQNLRDKLLTYHTNKS